MSNVIQTITKALTPYYESASEKCDSAQQVGWRDSDAQRRRFSALSQLIPKDSSVSLNDLGCGQGDLISYLKKYEFSISSYAGYDVMEDMLKAARNKHHRAEVAFHLIGSANEMRPANFTVASGIFNLRTNLPDEIWMSYILETLGHMDEKSDAGFAFNCLTVYSDSDHRKSQLYYADPLYLFDYCKKNFSKNVALLHDYGEYDFTILVKKY